MLKLTYKFASCAMLMLGAVTATGAFALQNPSPQSLIQATEKPATIVKDRAALEKLLGNSGVSIQWLGWSKARGALDASWKGKTLYLKGGQMQKDGSGKLEMDGYVVSISKDNFVFRGTITITNAPDLGRKCEKSANWAFAVTQKRQYWRMREFEWCDGLTDYIDIYF